jgi:hypothetical protein
VPAVSEQSPDLHAIFGIEETVADQDAARSAAGNGAIEHSVGIAAPEAPPAEAPIARETPSADSGEPLHRGLTKPSRRGSSSRFLTDVIIDMGLVPRPRVEEAIEASRSTGTTPERVLVNDGALTNDGLARST